MITKESIKPVNVLITGSRAPVALELSRRFASAGHRVFVAESVKHHLCRVSNSITRSYTVPKPNEDRRGYWQAIRSIVTKEHIDMVIPTCEEIFHLAEGKDFIEQGTDCTVWCESLDILEQLHHKYDFMKLAASYGLTVPLTRMIHSPEQLDIVLRGFDFKDKVVLKPVYSRFSAKVQVIDLHQTFVKRSKQLHRHISQSNPWAVQQHIEGIPYCSYTIAHRGRITAHVVYSPQFTAGRGAGILNTSVHHEGIGKWVEHFVHRQQFTGQISFDFIEAQDGKLFPIECNPRATSGVHLFPHDHRFVSAILCDSLYENKLLLYPENHTSCKLSMAMLLFGAKHLLMPHQWKAWIQSFGTSKDMIYSKDDPQPFWEQFRILLETIRAAKRHRISVLEASTIDIEWNGDER